MIDPKNDDLAGSVLAQLAAHPNIPVHTGLPQAQGDLLVLPADGKVPPASEPVPAAGVALLRGQGGHVHLLLGRVNWAPGEQGAQTLGTVTVPDCETGYLAHGDGTPVSALSQDAEHALVAFGPGTYVVRRQREQDDEASRLVED
jgi:hypothetical protein